MRTHARLWFVAALAIWYLPVAPAAIAPSSLVVVVHADTPTPTEDALQRICLGKVVEVDGRPVIPVNLAKGSTIRKDFMERVLAQDDDKYIAYWTMGRYIGKGSPPREFASIEEQLEYIRNTPGAVGDVDASAEVRPGLKPIMKKP